MTNKILIIDDDVELSTLLKKCIEKKNINVDVAHTGAKGIHLIDNYNYHLIVLDVMLPDINGFSLLSQIRQSSAIPVLMLTAKVNEEDKVNGLTLGADDYLTKPFGINELLARIESLIRRYTILNANSKESSEELHFNNLIINGTNRTVTLNNELISLTAKEFDLLYFLASNHGQIFTKKQLYNQVWEYEYAFDDSNIMSFISKLRKKIELDSQSPNYIQTIRGVGYRFNQEV